MSGFLSSVGTGIEGAFDSISEGVGGAFDSVSDGVGGAFDSVSDGVGDLFESDKPFGSSVDSSKAEYNIDGVPENLEALRIDAEYDIDTGAPLNESAVEMEKLYDDFAAKEDSKSGTNKKKKRPQQGASKSGSMTPKVIGGTGRLPGVDMPNARGGRFTQQQSPYAAPSYLQGSQAYNNQVSKLVQTLLGSQIRGRSIKSLI
tara:strand:- start:1148 stop:1753 length:606 start_codon:yes stop_codon:yes gene_type:complete